MPDRRTREVSVHFDGLGDAVGKGLIALRKKIRKPRLWYGVSFTVVSPLGQKVSGVFEEGS